MTVMSTANGTDTTDNRIGDLEQKFDQLAWYHAELSLRFTATAAVLAEMLAKQLQPRMREAILAQLLNGSTGNG